MTKTKNDSVLYKKGVFVPDGIYKGTMSGYEVEFIFASSMYWFRTEKGVRGINVPVSIKIKNNSERIDIEVDW